MKDKLMIIGASGHGKVVADIAKLNGYQEIYFLDDDQTKQQNGDYPVLGTTEDIEQYQKEYDFIVAIGNNKIRKMISTRLEEYGIEQVTLIHPSAIIDETVEIEKGTVVMANVVINASTHIGKYCIINTAATIDHDCEIDDDVHISPGVHIAGTVKIGESAWVGIGATIINNISIVNDCIIGSGSVVIRDLTRSGTYVGNPTRKVEK